MLIHFTLILQIINAGFDFEKYLNVHNLRVTSVDVVKSIEKCRFFMIFVMP